MARDQGRIGVILPASNITIEPDCCLLAPEGVTLHFTRIGGYDVDAIPDETVQRCFARESLDEALDLLTAASVDVIAYGCTSATMAQGSQFDRAFQADISTKTGLPTVTAAGAILAALEVLNVSRIAFTSPYVADLNQEAIAFLTASGVDVVHHISVSENYSSRDVGRVSPDVAYQLGCQADHSDAQAVVISCTDFRALEALQALERDLKKPVVTSNQALMYACLKRLGVGTAGIKTGGQLFSR